jgi:hypothetical protein
MTLRNITITVLVAAVVILVGWDLVAVAVGGVAATESDVIRDASQKLEGIAFAGGVIAGHWWLPRQLPLVRGPGRFYILGAMAVAAVGISIMVQMPMSLFLVAGLGAGHLLWPQSEE